MWIDQSLMRLCTSNRHYCEPDEIRLPQVTDDSKKEFYRVTMAERFRALLWLRKSKCPYPIQGDNGTAEECILMGHCACDESILKKENEKRF